MVLNTYEQQPRLDIQDLVYKAFERGILSPVELDSILNNQYPEAQMLSILQSKPSDLWEEEFAWCFDRTTTLSYIGNSSYLDPLEIDDICISEEPHILVAAIDFGSTYSGYTFSFVNSSKNIDMNRSWGENLGFQSYKTPTSVLVGPDGKFKAFGYEAEEIYSELVEDNSNSGDHELYRHLKMLLYEEGVSRSSKIKSLSGKECKAMDIFAMSIKYLKEHLLDAVTEQTTTVLEDYMVKWVLTVPAIWTDEAKQFMREVACKAGLIESISSQKLIIALEPEAASVYCKSLEIDNFIQDTTVRSLSFEPGTKYMVIDAGGGTIDITSYKVLQSGELKEPLAANVGPWGGTQVDQNFINLMKQVLGEKFIDTYRRDYPKQWLQFMTAFEIGKKVGSNARITIPLSWTMGCKYREVMDGMDMKKSIQMNTSDNDVTFVNGALVLGQTAVEGLFNQVNTMIFEHIISTVRKPELMGLNYVLFVGGFGESRLLQNALKERFSNIKVLVPEEAQMSVIKGAILFGHKPSDIQSRIARKTYGEETLRTFHAHVHDPRYNVIIEGREECDKLFKTYVQKGEEVPYRKEIKLTSVPVTSCQKNMCIKLFTLDRKASTVHSEYVDTPGFSQVGKLTVEMPDLTGGRKRRVDVRVVFGGTEIQAYARDRTSGCTANTTIDFLTD